MLSTDTGPIGPENGRHIRRNRLANPLLMRVVAEKLGHACRYYKLGHAWANGKKQSEEMRNREREKLGHEWATKRDT